MAVQIQVDQAAKPPGVPGEAREDLDTGTAVTLTATGGPFAQHQWTIIDRPVDIVTPAVSAAALSTPTAASTSVTPIDLEGTYLVEVAVDSGSGLGATADDIDRITFYAAPATSPLATDPAELPRRRPAFNEQLEHNVPDALFPGGNPRGWAQEWERWFKVLERAHSKEQRFSLAGFEYSGVIVPGFFEAPVLIRVPRLILEVSLIRRTAGTAGTTRLNLLKNGTTIFTNAAAQPQVTAVAGDNAIDVVSADADFADRLLAAGDRFEPQLEEVETFNVGPPEGPEGFELRVRYL